MDQDVADIQAAQALLEGVKRRQEVKLFSVTYQTAAPPKELARQAIKYGAVVACIKALETVA